MKISKFSPGRMSSSSANIDCSSWMEETRTWNCFFLMFSFSSNFFSLSSRHSCSCFNASIFDSLLSLWGWVMMTVTRIENYIVSNNYYWILVLTFSQGIVFHSVLPDSLGLDQLRLGFFNLFFSWGDAILHFLVQQTNQSENYYVPANQRSVFTCSSPTLPCSSLLPS